MWDSFLEMAVEYLRCQPDRLKAEFQLGIWPRYDYDQEAGTLTFSSDGKVFENVKHCSADVRAYGERRISGSRWQGALFTVLRNVRKPGQTDRLTSRSSGPT
jgi:hypothetical protein